MKKTILLLLSHSCNLNCRYCYERFKNSKKMTWEKAREILEAEFSCPVEEINRIDLLGGEPLTNFPLIPKICEWVWQRSPELKVFARTNGTLLTDEMKQWFVANKDRIVLGLSIDGNPEVNYINRGVQQIDMDFFRNNWPDNEVKMTIFPNSVHLLSSSTRYLYERGFRVVGGLAQGVLWDENSCQRLKEQMEELSEYYLSHPNITPLAHLFDLNFHRAFSPSYREPERPCWEVANIHSYDCEGNRYPCHMFSSIVQGKTKSKTILEDAKNVKHELLPKECQECPICWCCKKCMGINYQHTGDFGHNINLDYMCEAQKVAAVASAKLLLGKVMNNQIEIDSDETKLSVENAIKYLKMMGEFDNE